MREDPFQITSNPDYSKYIFISRYARWLESKGRRENWRETTLRLIEYWKGKFPEIADNTWSEVWEAIYNLEVMPSMRSLMTAGPALDRDNMAGFNCAYLVVDHPRAFDEALYVLMCGTGVGYSVERQYVQKLPDVAESFHETDTVIVFGDSKIGWASGFRELVSLLYAGKLPKFDYSKVRPAGARLKTFGGRASGPAPLKNLCEFTCRLFKKAAGRKLSSLECHDLVCKIADIVVVGGVRRSALISLSNLSDDRMRVAKSGQWWSDSPHRALANNSAVYDGKPDFEVFLKEWTSLYESKSGERGIFSRVAAQKKAASNGRRDGSKDFGVNPCCEIILRPSQVCNLTEVVIRPEDTFDTLARKVRLATILGTLQSTLTNFRYVRKVWATNTKEERLLGVSLTGIMDSAIMSNPQELIDGGNALDRLRSVAIETNKEWADRLGIEQSTAITTIKPSGTVSQLVDCSSGIHPRFSKYYLRTVRADVKDPLSQFMIDNGFYCEVDVMNQSNFVFYFPMKSPKTSVVVEDMRATDQLVIWEAYADHWCEHKPSMTCYYTDDNFMEVGSWIWKNFDKVSGISFLPYSDHVYQQAPYQPITEEEYDQWVARTPKNVDWSGLGKYEWEDNTIASQELACTAAGGCEI